MHMVEKNWFVEKYDRIDKQLTVSYWLSLIELIVQKKRITIIWELWKKDAVNNQTFYFSQKMPIMR